MCVRMCPLTVDEAQGVLDLRNADEDTAPRPAHAIRDLGEATPAPDAYPGSLVPVFAPGAHGRLVVAQLTWGFPRGGQEHAVFNTRIESALAQLKTGEGMWAHAMERGRCLVPVRAFYESHATERVLSERSGKPVRRQYRFRLPGARAFLIAGVHENGHLSIVTTTPNASVAPVHNRMPLVLGPGESNQWLGPGFAELADRSRIALTAEAER